MEISDNLSDKAKQDLILVQQAQQGKQEAFERLMERYREPIYFMLLKMVRDNDDADDLTIEAFGKAFNRIGQYSPNFAFSTWLFKIASNNCIDFIRKKRIQLTSIDTQFENEEGSSYSIDLKDSELDPEENIMRNQKIKMMRNLVEKLKPRYKILVEKRYFEELTYEEIADELNLPIGTVKAQLFRARDFLASMMKNTKDSI